MMWLRKTPNFHDRGGAEGITEEEPDDSRCGFSLPLSRTVVGFQRALPYVLFGISTVFLIFFPQFFSSGPTTASAFWAHGLYVLNVIALLLVIRESSHRRDA